MDPAIADSYQPRGLLRVGGATIVRHQLTLALAAGCERIVCHSSGLGPDLAELQREAERAGASFHLISATHALSALVTAADEVLVIAEGLLPTTGDALRLLSSGPVVLLLPSETGIPAGFERVDINHASAGLMLVPGRLGDRLMDLPPDADPAAALTRIALQAGVAQREVPDPVQQGGRWLLIRSEPEANEAEDKWMIRHTASGGRTAGTYAARTLVRRFGPALLHGGNSGIVGAATAGLLAALGLACAWIGWVTFGLVLCGGAWVMQRASSVLEQLRSEALVQRRSSDLRDVLMEAGMDIVLIAIMVISIRALPGELPIERCFAPVTLVGILRLLVRTQRDPWRLWFADRLVLCLGLAALALGGVLETGVPALCILLVLTGLALGRDDVSGQRLTQA